MAIGDDTIFSASFLSMNLVIILMLRKIFYLLDFCAFVPKQKMAYQVFTTCQRLVLEKI